MNIIDAAEHARIARQLRLPGFGLPQQEALRRAHVLIIGAGGLGCPVIQQLAAAGVGTLSIFDDDLIDLSNIHRQVLFGADQVGQSKAEVAAARARALQPGITVHAVRERITVANVLAAIQNADVVVDGSDTFATKYLVADACEITATPLVWGSVLRYSGDAALWHSGPGFKGASLRDLFPTQPPPDAVPDCASAGVLGVTTSIVGGFMATAAIGWITGLDRSVGQVTHYEAYPTRIRTMQVERDPDRPLVTELGDYGQATCQVADARLAAGAVLVDIREPGEQPDAPPSAIKVPGSTIANLEDLIAALPAHTDEVVLMCQKGVRSAKLLTRIQAAAQDSETVPATREHLGRIRWHSYPGGIEAWQRQQ